MARTIAFSLFVTMTLALASSGCASRRPAARAAASLDDTRAELVAGRQQITDVVATLLELEARPPTLTTTFDKYRSQVRSIERRAEIVKRRVQDIRLRSADYRAAWGEDTTQISNPELRAAAIERNEHVGTRYERLDALAQEVRTAYDPFITELRDLQTYLTNDLTYGGVDKAKPMFGTVRESATQLQDKIDAMIAELNESSARLSPTTRPAP